MATEVGLWQDCAKNTWVTDVLGLAVSLCACLTKRTIIVCIVPANTPVPWACTTGQQISGRSIR